ncbi:hypothetical protein ACFRJ9_21715 [Paenarthrobacter sp. NPDC056912]|uniref:hypothetical protein n=1 Tax=Paenarthrobacter sp. NPDC056912 TaxID=3345965 RepID=UPI00366FA472
MSTRPSERDPGEFSRNDALAKAGSRRISAGPGAAKRTGALALATTIAFSGVGAVAVPALLAVASAPAAHADEPGTRLHGVLVQVPPAGAFGDWGMWLGSTLVPNTNGSGYCFEMGEDARFIPGVEGTAAIDWLNVAITDNQADVSTHPALSYLVHEAADPRFNTPWNGVGAPYPNLRDSTDPQLVAIRAQAAQIKAAALGKTGPYTGSAALAMSDNIHGTVTNLSLKSSTGIQVNGVPMTATLTNAVWDGFGASITVKSGETLPAFTAAGTGPVSVAFEGTGPAGTVTTYTIDGGQDVLTGGATAPFSFRSADVQAVLDFQPVATSTAPVYLEEDKALTDVLHVSTSTGNANDWVFADGHNVPVVLDVDWYYSPVELAPSAAVPATAVKYASGTVTASGVGDVTATAAKKTDKPGFYYPVASFKKANQPEALQKYFTGDWAAGFNDPGEQTIVKYQPQVSTKASEIDADGMIHDIITVTGNQDGKELDVVTDLTLTSAAPVKGGVDEAPADAKTIGTVTTKVTGNGVFHSPGVKVPWELVEAKQDKDPTKPANLYFSEKIAATPTTKAWDGKELLPDETVSVGVPKAITKASVIENGKVHDVIEVTGNLPGKELMVSSDLFLTSAAPVKGGTDKAPVDAKLIGSVTTKVTGNGTFNTPSVDVPWEPIMNGKWAKDAAANLYWSEKIAPTDSTKGWDGKELLPNETVPVEKPAVSTQASANGTVPVTVTDKATVTGTVPTGEGVSTSLWWKLYKFGDDTTDSVQAVCQNDFWASKAAVDVTKAGDYTSEETTLTDKGTYGYIETLVTKYTDSTGNAKTAVLHQGKCGEKEESVVGYPKDIPPAPEKPQLQVPDQPAPVAYTGEVTAQQGINAPLLFGGAAVLVAMLAIGGGVYVQRRKAAAMNGAEDTTSGAGDLL